VSARDFYAELGIDVPDRGRDWVDIQCFNPDHDERRASCGVNLQHGGFNCQACGAKGSAYDAAVLVGKSPRTAAELAKRHGLGRWDDDPQQGEGGSQGIKQPCNRATPNSQAESGATPGCTVEQYAEAKRLPVDFLRSLGISDYKDGRWPDVRVLRIPYRDGRGNEPAVRIRFALDKSAGGGDRFLWRKGSKPLLYGLDRLDSAGEVVIVEGESDCHTLWSHDIAAVGLPGANGWKEERDAGSLAEAQRIFVIVEPDSGGDAVMGWLARSAIKDRVWLVELGEHKDPSGLHLADPDRFKERFTAALEQAEPWRVRAARFETAERREAGGKCAELARSPRILDLLVKDAARAGVTGEERTVKLIYLAATSRLLDRLASVVVKGQSASGKSWVVAAVLRFLPEAAYYALTAASEHALIYDKEPLSHCCLVIYEASGLESEKFSYIVRSLLSEGCLRYPTVVKREGELETVMIERPGPTNLITTTTAHRLHAENETRLLSLASDDSAEQTSAVLMGLAEEDGDGPDFGRWHALQRWLELGDRKVTIPYSKRLAALVPPAAVRLRRDFGSLLALVRAHALLHQASRDRDPRGRIVATIDDYAVVRELLAEVVSEAVERTVKPEVRELVAGVAAHGGEEVTQRQLVDELDLDKGTVSRRVRAALDGGYLLNREEKRGRPHKLVPGDPLPDDQEILPAPGVVGEELHGCTVAGGDTTPAPPTPNGGQRGEETLGAAWERLERERGADR
jgi:hypothetical protein